MNCKIPYNIQMNVYIIWFVVQNAAIRIYLGKEEFQYKGEVYFCVGNFSANNI